MPSANNTQVITTRSSGGPGRSFDLILELFHRHGLRTSRESLDFTFEGFGLLRGYIDQVNERNVEDLLTSVLAESEIPTDAHDPLVRVALRLY